MIVAIPLPQLGRAQILTGGVTHIVAHVCSHVLKSFWWLLGSIYFLGLSGAKQDETRR